MPFVEAPIVRGLPKSSRLEIGLGGLRCAGCVDGCGNGMLGITIVNPSSSATLATPLSTEAVLSIPGLLLNGIGPDSSWFGSFPKGMTIVKSSFLEGLTTGVGIRVLSELGVLRCVVIWSNLDLLLIGLTFGLCPGAVRDRILLFGGTDFLTVSLAGVFSGVIEGVAFLALRLLAYGSAVAGRASSGLRGGLRGADIREPDPLVFDDAKADLADADVDIAEGGRGTCDVLDVEGCIRVLIDVVNCDFTGEKVARAELGRSGRFLAAAILALFCSAIFSFKVDRAAAGPADPVDFENTLTLLV